MRDFVLGFLTVIFVLATGLLGYLRLGLAQVEGDVHAPAWESQLMNFAVHASVRRNAGKAQNPLPPTDETLIAGGKLYANGCAGCHGDPAKPGTLTPAYFVPPPQLGLAGTQYSEPELFWIVKHGIRRTGMSSYGPFYTDQQIWSLASFVKQMKNLSPAVLEGIQTRNP